MAVSMLAPSARIKAKPDNSFGAALTAGDAVAKYGVEKVVDATLGVIKDEHGHFATLPTAEKIYRQLPSQELCDYADIPGLEFRDAAIAFTFQGHQPRGSYARAVATPGGSGAIHNAIYNYVERDEKYLIPDWCWGPYREMGVECGKEYVQYPMFDAEQKRLNVEAILRQSRDLLKEQDGLLTIFNTPAHNPSGYSMSQGDWQQLTAYYREAAEDKSKRIIVLWDMAYTDYAGDKDEVREFLHCFDDMPENVLLLIAFSMSKSFLIYGMRSGALIGVSSSREVIEEFDCTSTYSNRATWSNGSRGAQRLLAMVMADPLLKERTDQEREVYRKMIAKRAQIFCDEAEEIHLPILPYSAGFFITLPAKDQFGLVDELREDLIFSIPLDSGGVRFAMSAVPSWQVPGLAAKVKKRFLEGGHELN